MFVKILAADGCHHHVNMDHVSQVVDVSGMLRVEFSFANGENGKMKTLSFNVTDLGSKTALLSALKTG